MATTGAWETRAEGKGSFEGELLIETQPTLSEGVALPKGAKVALSAIAQVAVVVAAVLFYSSGVQLAELLHLVINIGVDNSALLNNAFSMVNNLLMLIFAWLTFRAAGSILNNSKILIKPTIYKFFKIKLTLS